MTAQPDAAAQRFAVLVDELAAANPALQAPASGTKKEFGSSTLKINNRIFAMLVNDRLVVKLPRLRVDALIAAGHGERFDPGHGRLMKEWVTVGVAHQEAWLPLAKEALDFVSSKR